jgi:hypothetical protein
MVKGPDGLLRNVVERVEKLEVFSYLKILSTFLTPPFIVM